jgi:hypothetical protein
MVGAECARVHGSQIRYEFVLIDEICTACGEKHVAIVAHCDYGCRLVMAIILWHRWGSFYGQHHGTAFVHVATGQKRGWLRIVRMCMACVACMRAPVRPCARVRVRHVKEA